MSSSWPGKSLRGECSSQKESRCKGPGHGMAKGTHGTEARGSGRGKKAAGGGSLAFTVTGSWGSVPSVSRP